MAKKSASLSSVNSVKKYAPLLVLLAGIIFGAYILYSQMLTHNSSASEERDNSPKRCGSPCSYSGECLRRQEGVPDMQCQRARGAKKGMCVPLNEGAANAACLSDLAAARSAKEGIGSPYQGKAACGEDCTKSSQCDSKGAGIRLICKEVYDSARQAKRKVCAAMYARDKSRCVLPGTMGTPYSPNRSGDPGDGFIRP